MAVNLNTSGGNLGLGSEAAFKPGADPLGKLIGKDRPIDLQHASSELRKHAPRQLKQAVGELADKTMRQWAKELDVDVKGLDVGEAVDKLYESLIRLATTDSNRMPRLEAFVKTFREIGRPVGESYGLPHLGALDQAVNLLRRTDANGDGKVSLGELNHELQSNQLSADDRAALKRAKETLEELMIPSNAWDVGVLGDTWSAAPLNLKDLDVDSYLYKIDVDGDGVICETDLRAAMLEMSGKDRWLAEALLDNVTQDGAWREGELKACLEEKAAIDQATALVQDRKLDPLTVIERALQDRPKGQRDEITTRDIKHAINDGVKALRGQPLSGDEKQLLAAIGRYLAANDDAAIVTDIVQILPTPVEPLF
jgi:Ca2+-binding EF-hand superfamily protein